MFLTSPIPILPDPSQPFFVNTDASNVDLGGVLLQKKKDVLHPCGYFSKKLNTAEQNYSVYNKELLAILETLKHLGRFLEETEEPILILNDHKNLLAFTSNEKCFARHVCWEVELANFNFILEYIPGATNTLPNALSRCGDYYTNKNDCEAYK